MSALSFKEQVAVARRAEQEWKAANPDSDDYSAMIDMQRKAVDAALGPQESAAPAAAPVAVSLIPRG